MARKPNKRDARDTGAAKLPGELTGIIASTGNGRDITRPWVGQLQEPRDPRLLRSVDWGIYETIRKDDQVKSTFAQRIGAVVSREWDVIPGDEEDPRSVKAADVLKQNLQRLSWDRLTAKMLWATFYGYSVGELVYGRELVDGYIQFEAIKVRHARRFRYDKEDRLRLITPRDLQGEILPDRKFWVVTEGATDDDEPYGHGLADWLYWPTLFKRNGIRFWNIFLDKFGTPTAKGTYRRGTPKDDIAKLLQALQALSTDSGFVVPEGIAVELLQAAKSGTADYEKLCRYMDEAIAKIVLGQTMTTQDGSSRSQAEVHAGVKLEIVATDADMLSDSFNNGPARWWTDINFGTDVASPEIIRKVEEEEDTKKIADTDAVLAGMGWVRTEESFKDVYGDGYERKAEPVRVDPASAPAAPLKPGDKPVAAPDAANDADQPKPGAKPLRVPASVASFAAQDPRPLYVYRKLLNAADLVAWAKKEGFTTSVSPDEMHCTVTYSKRPVNWLKMGGFWGYMGDEEDRHTVPPGGPRLVERLGREGAVVLHFYSGHLDHRHKEMVEAGASLDFPEYMPHVTFTYDPGDLDLKKVTPYRGKLVFGPEIFEPIEEDWADRIRELRFAEPLGGATVRGGHDDVDRMVDQLIAESGFTPIGPIMTPIAEAIARSGSAEELEATLIASLGQSDVDQLVATIARAGFAVRLAARLGADDA